MRGFLLTPAPPGGLGAEGDGASGGLAVTALGRLAVSEDPVALVRQSVRFILQCRPGDRVMRPEFGSRLHTLAFEPNDAVTAALAERYCREALTRWEPRIVDLEVRADEHPGDPTVLLIELAYRAGGRAVADRLQVQVGASGEGSP